MSSLQPMSTPTRASLPSRPSIRWSRIVVVGLVGACIAAALLGNRIRAAADIRGDLGGTYATHFAHASSGIDRALAFGDGQAYATIAHDPTLSEAGGFVHGRDALSYRAARPIWSYAAALAAWSDWHRIPWVLALFDVIAAGFAVGALAVILRERGASSWLALLLLLVPGALATVLGLTPELLAVGAGLLAIRASERGSPGAVAGWMTLAVMSRDTMLLVGVAIAVHAMWRHRPRMAVPALVIPAALLATWWMVLRVRVGAWPTWGSRGNFGPPLRGIWQASGTWGDPSVQWLLVAILAATAVLAVIIGRRDPYGWVVALYALAAPLMGVLVWQQWPDWTRLLLPMQACALVVLLPAAARRLRSRRVEVAALEAVDGAARISR